MLVVLASSVGSPPFQLLLHLIAINHFNDTKYICKHLYMDLVETLMGKESI